MSAFAPPVPRPALRANPGPARSIKGCTPRSRVRPWPFTGGNRAVLERLSARPTTQTGIPRDDEKACVDCVPELVAPASQSGPVRPPVAQGGGTTPDGTTLGPTDPAQHVCLASNRLIWVGGPNLNTATAANGRSRVTASVGAPPDCDCGCGLFRQFIRGFWRTGSATAPKRHDVSSCGNPVTMSETAWTEEFEACNPGGAPKSDDCQRTYLDAPGWGSGLSDGDFVEMRLTLRYQMWDQCRGVPVATGDRTLHIVGDKAPRTITFS